MRSCASLRGNNEKYLDSSPHGGKASTCGVTAGDIYIRIAMIVWVQLFPY